MFYYLKLFFIPSEGNNFRPRILEGRCFYLVLIFLFGVKVLSLVSFDKFLGADIFNQITQSDLYVLTNQIRKSNNVSELTVNPKLELAAQMKLEDMFKNSYFGHNSPSGVSPWVWFDKANYDYSLAGENLAMNFFSSDQAMKAWLASESHRHNVLLSEFRDIGIAVGSGKVNNQETIAVVQLFGKSRAGLIRTAQAQTKPLNAKPTATKKPVIKPSPKVSLTPKPKASTFPSPIFVNVITRSNTSSPVLSPQVKAAEVNKDELSTGMNAYSYNIFFNKLMIGLAMMLLGVLFLKVLVKINIQFPDLIFRSVLLLIVSIVFIYIEDKHILTLLKGQVLVP